MDAGSSGGLHWFIPSGKIKAAQSPSACSCKQSNKKPNTVYSAGLKSNCLCSICHKMSYRANVFLSVFGGFIFSFFVSLCLIQSDQVLRCFLCFICLSCFILKLFSLYFQDSFTLESFIIFIIFILVCFLNFDVFFG